MKEKLHLPILIEQDEDGVYIVSCNSFKGCHSYGKTVNEAIENIKEVISMCMEEQVVYENSNQFIGFRELEISI
ncbi:MAG: type II toxin-antitoxin system HicB family antitoxin [Bacteroidetes bacterium]|nr:type II toxin-antitoxin system HicB family antitoxin [Bacteroidota bacterium]